MVRLIVCCVGIVSSLPAVDGLELVRSDGGERLTAGGTELLVLSTPWVANSDWKGIYRLEYNRDFALNGSRKGWFELSLSGERFESKLVPLTAGPESTVKGIPFRRGAIETESDMTLAAIALWHTADGVARRGEQVGGMPVSSLRSTATPAEEIVIALDGTWRFDPEGDAGVRDIQVPSRWELASGCRNVHTATYSRKFDLPPCPEFRAAGNAGRDRRDGSQMPGRELQCPPLPRRPRPAACV